MYGLPKFAEESQKEIYTKTKILFTDHLLLLFFQRFWMSWPWIASCVSRSAFKKLQSVKEKKTQSQQTFSSTRNLNQNQDAGHPPSPQPLLPSVLDVLALDCKLCLKECLQNVKEEATLAEPFWEQNPWPFLPFPLPAAAGGAFTGALPPLATTKNNS